MSFIFAFALETNYAIVFFFLFTFFRVALTTPVCNLPFPIIGPVFAVQRYRIAGSTQWKDRKREEKTVLYIPQAMFHRVPSCRCKMVPSLPAFDVRWFIVPMPFVSMQAHFPTSQETPILQLRDASRASEAYLPQLSTRASFFPLYDCIVPFFLSLSLFFSLIVALVFLRALNFNLNNTRVKLSQYLR